MKIRNQKSIKAISLAVLAIGAIYLAFVYYRTITMLWFNEAPDRIVWNQGQMGWQSLSWQDISLAGRPCSRSVSLLNVTYSKV